MPRTFGFYCPWPLVRRKPNRTAQKPGNRCGSLQEGTAFYILYLYFTKSTSFKYTAQLNAAHIPLCAHPPTSPTPFVALAQRSPLLFPQRATCRVLWFRLSPHIPLLGPCCCYRVQRHPTIYIFSTVSTVRYIHVLSSSSVKATTQGEFLSGPFTDRSCKRSLPCRADAVAIISC